MDESASASTDLAFFPFPANLFIKLIFLSSFFYKAKKIILRLMLDKQETDMQPSLFLPINMYLICKQLHLLSNNDIAQLDMLCKTYGNMMLTEIV